MQITTKAGNTINLHRTGDSLAVTTNGISFAVTQTAIGCKSRWAVREFKGRVEIILEGENLAAANRMFAEMAAEIDERLAAEYGAYARHNAVLRTMHSDANAV